MPARNLRISFPPGSEPVTNEKKIVNMNENKKYNISTKIDGLWSSCHEILSLQDHPRASTESSNASEQASNHLQLSWTQHVLS
mmetsp:Transcript_46722/g.97760  ORF Transcript_46722/g.97760 Transcript_46722/m.97760 type:complete len:83 (+) Transcript_46722:845-1093(+)